MSEPSQTTDESSINPFQTPRATPAEVETTAPVEIISPVGVFIGLLMGALIGVSNLCLWANLLESTFLESLSYNRADIPLAVIVGPGAVIFGTAYWRRQWTALEPGHWLWIAASTLLVGKLLSAVCLATGILNDETGTLGTQIVLEFGLPQSLATAYFLSVIRTNHQARVWQFVARLCLIHCAIGTFGYLLAPTYYDNLSLTLARVCVVAIQINRLSGFALLAFILVAAIDDNRHRRHRALSHYAGLLIPLFVVGLPYLLFMF